MREIKFRAWDKSLSRWVIDVCVHEVINHEGERFILQQFTGKLDKNGKEIYEGDYISHPEASDITGEVFWDMEGICWSVKWVTDELLNQVDMLCYALPTEVVGNKYG